MQFAEQTDARSVCQSGGRFQRIAMDLTIGMGMLPETGAVPGHQAIAAPATDIAPSAFLCESL